MKKRKSKHESRSGKPPPKGKIQGALFGRGSPPGGKSSVNKDGKKAREKRLEGKAL